MLLLKQFVSVCPGDEGHPPVAPLPHPHIPHLGPPLALLPVHVAPGVDAGKGMGGDRGREGVPGLTLGVEGGTGGPDPGGDVTGRDRGPTTETGSETETGSGTGDGTRHANERGPVPAHGTGAVRDEGLGAVEATGGGTATVTVPLSPPVAVITVPPLLTEEPSPLPPPSLTS